MRKLSLFTIAGLTLLALACSLSAARADYIFNVSIDTSSLSSNNTGPFGIDFELTSGGSDTGNTATISNFGGGSLNLLNSSNLGTNGYYDSALSTVVLSVSYPLPSNPNVPSIYLSDFNVEFTPGSQLTFQVDLTTNPPTNSPYFPDAFSIYLLKNYSADGGTPISTTDSTNSTLLTDNITPSAPVPVTYESNDPNDPFTTNASPVPEPGTLVLSLMFLGSLATARGWKRLRRTKADLGEQLV